MKINMTGRHVEVTDALKQAVGDSLDKIIRHYPDIDNIHVILSVEKNEKSAEAIIHYMGQDLVAKCANDDLYKAIHDVRGKAEVLLKKRKSQIKDHGHSKLTDVASLEEED